MPMKFKAALFYNGFIVFYDVFRVGDEVYKAKLDSSLSEITPPELIELKKNGSNWVSSCEHFDISKEIGAAIDQQKNKGKTAGRSVA